MKGRPRSVRPRTMANTSEYDLLTLNRLVWVLDAGGRDLHLLRRLPFARPSLDGCRREFVLGLLVNRRMARDFGGDSTRIRRASAAEVSRAMDVSLSRWNSAERQAFENWSLVLALIPDLRRWSAKEKQDVIKIIRAQAGFSEMRYLRLTQQHPRLREALLRLGSKG